MMVGLIRFMTPERAGPGCQCSPGTDASKTDLLNDAHKVFQRIFRQKNKRRNHITFQNYLRFRSDWSFLLVCTFVVILGSTLGRVMDVFFKISLPVIVGIGMF